MVKGSCHCGQLSYEIQDEPQQVIICHCVACRKASGAQGSFNLFVPTDKFESNGEFATYRRSGDSGKSVTNHVCAKCFNLMFVKPEAMEGVTIVKGGTIDDEAKFEALKPQAEIYTKDRAGWCAPMCAEQKEVM